MNIVSKILHKHANSGICVSIEISPPNKIHETRVLLRSINKLHMNCNPIFYAVTWHQRQCTTSANEKKYSAIELAAELQSQKKDVLLHLAAQGLSKKNVLKILKNIKKKSINNVFALRGDNKGKETNAFPHAHNLVTFIHKHNDGPTICVAGYPNGHPESTSYEDDLTHLKKKVEAGASFIITQIIFDAFIFKNFVKDCRNRGIKVPILPGIMLIKDYDSFQYICKLGHLQVPPYVSKILESIKHNSECVKNFGIYHAVDLARNILSMLCTPGLHFFTLNQIPGILQVCRQLGFTPSPLYIYIHPVLHEQKVIHERQLK